MDEYVCAEWGSGGCVWVITLVDAPRGAGQSKWEQTMSCDFIGDRNKTFPQQTSTKQPQWARVPYVMHGDSCYFRPSHLKRKISWTFRCSGWGLVLVWTNNETPLLWQPPEHTGFQSEPVRRHTILVFQESSAEEDDATIKLTMQVNGARDSSNIQMSQPPASLLASITTTFLHNHLSSELLKSFCLQVWFRAGDPTCSGPTAWASS